MPETISVDPEALRADVREKYREVALHPDGEFHFHTGRPLAALLGYDPPRSSMPCPIAAVESFAGVGNPFSLRPLRRGERSSTSARAAGSTASSPPEPVGADGRVIGVDMTPEMLAKSASTAERPRTRQRRVPRGSRSSTLPVEDGWADVVISNGVINLCADKAAVFAETYRVLRPGGVLQFADIANGKPAARGRSVRDRPVDRLHRRRPAPLTTGARRSRAPGSTTSASGSRSTRSAAPVARPTPVPTTWRPTCSSPTARRERLRETSTANEEVVRS